MFVIGTAGHVDHGKSTLVKALTGIDPDRLREEKERGMTIDLGFAWLQLPSGREVSVVDVPGHERFIKNMLAGVGGIDLALLVIAADEGIMPQTEEHLAIVELLRIRRAVVALTKHDLVEPDWLELVTADVADRLGRSSLGETPIVPVSAMSGFGLADLRAALDRALDDTPAKENVGRPRLPIDRVFTIAGFGTVVTGTLIGGTLQTGQELEVQPGGLRVRIRGLQTHKHKVGQAEPGARVAVNLSGVAVDELHRGQVLTTAGWIEPSIAADVQLNLRASAGALRHNAQVSFHSGSAESIARVGLLDRDHLDPGESGWAQLHFREPIALAKGDLFVIRTTMDTVGGGEVVDPVARRHRRRQATVLDRLELLQRGSPEELILQAIASRPFAEAGAVAQGSGVTVEQVRGMLPRLELQGVVIRLGDGFLTVRGWSELRRQVEQIVDDYHRQFPLRVGIPREELKSRLKLATKMLGVVVERLATEGSVEGFDVAVRRVGRAVELTPAQAAKADRLIQELAGQPYAPPALDETAAGLGLDEEVLNALADQGRIVRINESIAYTPEAFQAMRERIIAHAREKGSITVAEVRDLFDTSRKYALALMEYFDQQRLTRRIGDTRVLRP